MTSSKPNCLPKAPPPNTITLGAEVSTSEFQGDTNIQSITVPFIQKRPQMQGVCVFVFVEHAFTQTSV